MQLNPRLEWYYGKAEMNERAIKESEESDDNPITY